MEITLTISLSGKSHDLDLAKWLKTALHAALSGIALTTAAINIDPATFNLSQAKHLLEACALGALIGLVGLLRKSPLAPKSDVPQA